MSSQALLPLVCGIFLLTYIGIAFSTDDALIALMEYTRSSVVLTVLLALIPMNSACRILAEAKRYIKRRRALRVETTDVPATLFDETVEMSVSPSFGELQARLKASGYSARQSDNALVAWRGLSIFPARILFLAASFCIFAGILVSLTTRTSHRMAVIEGQPIPTATGGGGLVERITMRTASGSVLARVLSIEVAQSDSGDAKKVFGLYPPSTYRGYFVYPRYLGFAPVIRLSTPDAQNYETQGTLNIYPPGREDRVKIPGSPYLMEFSMAQPPDGSDPFITGRVTFLFRLLKGKDVLFAGSAPVGGEFVHDGYRLAIPDCRRMVITDFIRDYGVLLVWTASILYLVSGCIWLPVRVFAPRREMRFTFAQDALQANSRAEGGRRKHGGIFHEALDYLESGRSKMDKAP